MNRLLVPLALLSVLVAGLFVWAHWPVTPLPPGAHVERLVLLKSGHRLLVLEGGGRTLASYRVALGRHPRGPKQVDGDGRTPEGTYVIDYHLPATPYWRALHVSYPSAADWARASARGVDPGGHILIEGLPRRLVLLGRMHRFLDWTDGSIALTDGEMRQIYRNVPDGTPIELRP